MAWRRRAGRWLASAEDLRRAPGICKLSGPSPNLYNFPMTGSGLPPYHAIMTQQLRWVLMGAAVSAAALLQVLPVGPARDNPAVEPAHTIEAAFAVPADVRAIFNRACKNCHSNETVWPWYSQVAPGSWLVTRDVVKARKAMNLSTWKVGAGRTPGLGAATLAAACADVRSGRMPLPQYQVMHPESRLTKSDQDLFCDWANQASHDLLTSKPGRTTKSEARVHGD